MIVETAGCPARLGCMRALDTSRVRHPIPTTSRSTSVTRSYATGACHGACHGAFQSRVCPFATVSARPWAFRALRRYIHRLSTAYPRDSRISPPIVAAPGHPVSPHPAALASVSAHRWRLPLHSSPNSVPCGPEWSVRNGRPGRMAHAMGSAPARPPWRVITHRAPESAGSAHTMRERVAARGPSSGSQQGQERGVAVYIRREFGWRLDRARCARWL